MIASSKLVGPRHPLPPAAPQSRRLKGREHPDFYTKIRPGGGDCFVALRAPRNDGIHQTIRVIASEAKQSRLTCSRRCLAHQFRHHSFSVLQRVMRHRCRAAHPGGLSDSVVGFVPFAPHTEGSGAPKFAAAERRDRWSALRTRPIPSADGICRSITRTGAPRGAPPRRFP